MNVVLKILHIEDNALDAELISAGLRDHGVAHEIKLIDSREQLCRALEEQSYDLVLCDYSIPHFGGSEALSIVREKAPHIPFIFVSGTIGEERAVEVLKKGATDYVLKGSIDKLYPAITRALEEYERKKELKLMNELVHINEERLNYVLKATKDVVWDLDIEQSTVWRNDAALELFGEDPANHGYDWWKSRLHPADRDRVESSLDSALVNGSNTWHEEYQIMRADKTVVHVSDNGFIIRNADGKAIRMIGAMRDVSKQLGYLKALQASEEKYRTLVDTSPDAIFLANGNGIIVFANRQIAELFCYTQPEDLYGKSIFDFFVYEEAGWLRDKVRLLLSGGAIRNLELKLLKNDGGRFIAEISISAVLDESGSPDALIGIIRDITLRKENEADLLRAKEKAEEMNRVKTAFLANMSHELRTPLIAILGYAEILENELSDEALKNMAKTIFRGGHRLSETLNLILDLSKIESEKLTYQFKKIELGAMLPAITDMYQGLAQQKDLTLFLSPPDYPVYVTVDSRLLSDVVSNLINNAIKFSANGSVEVKYKIVPYKGGKWAEIQIADTGIGIDEKDQQTIFEEFRQVSEGLSRQYEGTGLGLTIAKKFVELMHGDLSVKSAIGLGSTFFIRLPLE